MTIMTRLSSIFQFLCLLMCFLFGGCTGGASSKPFDGEFVQGRTPNTFIKTSSATSATAIVTEGSGKQTTKIQIEKGKIISTAEVEPSLVQLSVDMSILVIRGEPGIYELSENDVNTIVSKQLALPPATVESFCTNASEAGFTELHVQAQAGIYSFVGVTESAQTSIGGDGTIARGENHQYVQYQKDGFGSMVIDKSNALPTDSHFFKAFFQLQIDSPWKAVNSMYCHLNNVPTGISKYAFWDAFSAADNTALVAHTSNSGQVWSPLGSPVPVIIGNAITMPLGSVLGTWANALTDVGTSDFTLSVDVSIKVSNWGTMPDIHFRYLDEHNNWYVIINSSVFAIAEVTNGVTFIRSSIPTGAVSVGTFKWLLTLSGTHISTTLGGRTLSYESSRHQEGTKLALQVSGRSGDNSFSNLKIVSPDNLPNLVGSRSLPINFHTLFVTSVEYNGNLGGLSGGDARCTDRARHGVETMSLGGVWKAILSTSAINEVNAVNAKDRIALSTGFPIKNTHGETIVSNAQDLWKSVYQASPAYDEFGSFSNSPVWTGCLSNGMSQSDNCGNWTDETSSHSGTTGSTGGRGAGFMSGGTLDGCMYSAKLYCINTNN